MCLHLNVPGRGATCARHLGMAWGGTAQAEDGWSVFFGRGSHLGKLIPFFFGSEIYQSSNLISR